MAQFIVQTKSYVLVRSATRRKPQETPSIGKGYQPQFSLNVGGGSSLDLRISAYGPLTVFF
jgi:hypothetical protein